MNSAFERSKKENRQTNKKARKGEMLQKKGKVGEISSFAPIQTKANKTGLPDQLKSGVEQLSGYSMDDVKVHYNSPKPAQLQAHAYAQGTDIHIASGQEKHLPHEAWHVVQQKQGRVKPTMQLKEKVNINDDDQLEREADVMGAAAMSKGLGFSQELMLNNAAVQRQVIQRNVVVEASLDPLQDNLFSNLAVAGRPPTLLGGSTQGNHTTPFAVFVSGIRNHVIGRTYQQAFRNILSIARTDRQELPGMAIEPDNERALAAYQNFLDYAGAINPATRSDRHWVADIQQLTARYLTFRNLVPLSTEAGDPHGGDSEGDITRELELIDTRLRGEDDFRPPKDQIRILFTSLFDSQTSLGPEAAEQHKISIINAYPTTYEYAYT